MSDRSDELWSKFEQTLQRLGKQSQPQPQWTSALQDLAQLFEQIESQSRELAAAGRSAAPELQRLREEAQRLREEAQMLRAERDVLREELRKLQNRGPAEDPRFGQALKALRELKAWIKPPATISSESVRAPFEQLREQLATK